MTIAEPNERATIGGNNPPISEVLAEQYRDLVAKIEPIAERANALPRKVESDEDLGPVGDIIVDASALSKEIEKARKAEKEPHDRAGKEVQAFFLPLKDRLDRISTAFQTASDEYQRQKAAAARRAAEEEARKLREEEERLRREADEAKRPATADRKLDKAEEIADQREEAEARAAATNADLTRIRTDTGVTAGTRTVWNFQITDYDAIPLDKLRPFLKREHVEGAIRSMVNIQKGSTKLDGVRVFEDIKSTFRR